MVTDKKTKQVRRSPGETEKLHVWIWQRLGDKKDAKSTKSLFLQMKKEDQDYLCQWGNPIAVLTSNITAMRRKNGSGTRMVVGRQRVCVGEHRVGHNTYPKMETRYYKANPLLRLVK